MSASAPAQTSTWNLDSDHSDAGFAVRHMMISTVKGRFGEVAGTIEIDSDDVRRSHVSARISTASLDTGSGQRDGHLRSGDFFDVENHPWITFESREVREQGNGRLEVVGDLTIRDVTREVVLQVEEEGRGIDPWGGERVAFRATTAIDRTAFGLNWNQALEAGGVLVSNEVKITLDVQAVRA
jgi:polyisoprenoid-binding protein YceI